MATVTSVPGTLDITPDPLQKQSKVQIRRNNKKGRIEIVTSTDSGNNYKTLLPEVTSKVQSGSIPVVQESGDVEWSVLAAKASTLTGVVPYVNGGTGQSSYAPGDILYANQQGVLSKLPIGSNNQLLTVNNESLIWKDATYTPFTTTIESATLIGNTTLSSTSTFTPAAGATLDLSAANVILPTSTLSGFGYKAPVRAATTANIALSGTQTIDTAVALVAGDRVLVKNQSTASQNGIYIVNASTWTRSTDLNVWSEASAAVVVVQEGTLNQDTVWLSTANASGGTIGSTNMPWGMIGVDQTGFGLTTQVLVGGGDNIKPVWTTATGTGAPVRAGSPTFTGNVTFGGHILPSLDNTYDIGQNGEPRIRNIYCIGTAALQAIVCATNAQIAEIEDYGNSVAFMKTAKDSTHSFFITNRTASALKVAFSIGTEDTTQTADLFHCYQNSVQKFGVSTEGTVTLAGKVIIPVTSATAGIIEQNGERFIHSFTPASKNQNIFIGYQAGRTSTMSEGGNLGIGRVVMTSLTEGASNVCLGDGAGYKLTSGSSNVIVGVSAANNLTTGAYNVACGQGSLGTCSGSNSNAAFGHQALGSQTGTQSTGIGMNAGYSSTGNNNVFVGETAGYAGTTVGNLLGIAVGSGTNNTMLGQASSSTLAAGTYRTAIGSDSRCQMDNAIKLGRDYSANNAGDRVIFPSFPTANLPTADVVSGMVVNDSTINTLKYHNGTAWNPVVTAETLTGATLASTVLASSLTSVGTITSGTWNANVIVGAYGGTGVNNTGKTITLGGNLTTIGAHTTTLTTTGNTTVTLPVSGTLVTQTALDLKANLASPIFTGTVTIPSGASIFGFAPLASPTFTGTVGGITNSMVGLSNVDNTTDLGKPVSTATQTALDLKLASAIAASTYAPLVSPTFTGAPLLPTGTIATTQTPNDNTTALATTAFVTTADNLKANLASPTFTGIPLSTTAAVNTNTTQIATTAYVIGQGYAKVTGVAITPTTGAFSDATDATSSISAPLKTAGGLGVGASLYVGTFGYFGDHVTFNGDVVANKFRGKNAGAVTFESNINETFLSLSQVANSVNNVAIEPNITGSPVHIYAQGTDENIGLHLQAKGTGFVNVQDGTDTTKRLRFGASGNSTEVTTTLASSSTTSQTITLPNATTTLAGLAVTQTFTAANTFSSSTASTSTASGAVVITGGLGVGGNAYVGGVINISSSTASTSTASGAVVITGGLGVGGNAYVGGVINISSSTASISTASGAVVITGGLGVGGNAYVGGVINLPETTATAGSIFQGSLRIFHTYGLQNLFIGKDCGNVTTVSGASNVVVSREGFKSLTTGARNTGIGDGVSALLTTGFDNTLAGCFVGAAFVGASENVAMGKSALSTNVSSNRNTAIGMNALGSCIGGHNIGLGFNSGFYITGTAGGAGQNTCLGNTSGVSETAVGGLTPLRLTTGTQNTFVGFAAGSTSNSSLYRTAIGASSVCQSDNSIKLGRDTLDKVIIPSWATAPTTSLSAGMLYYDTTLAKLRVYTTAWETITSV